MVCVGTGLGMDGNGGDMVTPCNVHIQLGLCVCGGPGSAFQPSWCMQDVQVMPMVRPSDCELDSLSYIDVS